MPESIYVLVNFVLIFIDILTLAMSLRAILSWIFVGSSGKFMNFLYVMTEPLIMPMRKLFYKLNWFQGTPMDMAYLFTYIVFFLIESMVSMLVY